MEYQFSKLAEYVVDRKQILPPIETVLYTNHDLFDGSYESIGTAYLNADLKQFTTNNVIGKGQLIKEKHNS